MNRSKSVLKKLVSILILLGTIALNPAYGIGSIQWEVPVWTDGLPSWTGGLFVTTSGSAQPSTSEGSWTRPGGTFAIGYWLNYYNFRSSWEHEAMTERNSASDSLNLIDTGPAVTGTTFTSTTFTRPTFHHSYHDELGLHNPAGDLLSD